MSDSFVIPWIVAWQASLSIGFPKKEYWSGLPFPSPGDLPGPGIKPASPALAGQFFTIEPPEKSYGVMKYSNKSIVVMDAQLCEYNKNYGIVLFKWVEYKPHESYLQKAVLSKECFLIPICFCMCSFSQI